MASKTSKDKTIEATTGAEEVTVKPRSFSLSRLFNRNGHSSTPPASSAAQGTEEDSGSRVL